MSIHILFLKCDGTKFPRNAYANALEVYCSTYFYGPLVVSYCDQNSPFKLYNFTPEMLHDQVQSMNEEEQKIYPLPFSKLLNTLIYTN
jgi:hypothetical protein